MKEMIFLSYKNVFFPMSNFVKGYCDHFCLSVSVCVCHFVDTIKGELSIHPIFMKFGQIVYNHNRKVKFEDRLHPLIFKAIGVKNRLK